MTQRLISLATACALAWPVAAMAGPDGNKSRTKAKPSKQRYQVEVIKLTRQPALAIRGEASPTELEDQLRAVMPRLMSHVFSNQLDMAGPPFVRYFERTDKKIVYEAGIPVLNPGKGEGDIKPIALPAGPAITTLHVGPYEGLPRAHAALAAWAKRKRKTAAGASWEVFLTNPLTQRDPSRWQTKVFMPLSK